MGFFSLIKAMALAKLSWVFQVTRLYNMVKWLRQTFTVSSHIFQPSTQKISQTSTSVNCQGTSPKQWCS